MSKAMTVKKFIALSCEAIEGLSKKDARETYKSIKNKSNKLWLKFSDAETALSLKVELNEQIEEIEDEMEDNPNEKDKLTKQLNIVLSKHSTIRAIRDLELAFNKPNGSFAQITEKSKIEIKPTKKQLIASTTNDTTHEEDSDEDDDVFSYAAYMKLREQNNLDDDEDPQKYVEDIHKKIKNTIQSSRKKKRKKNNVIPENKSTPDMYPVDHNANYNIIAQHFKHNVTKNKNVDHSVLDFDDLKSIRLDQEDDDEYADSQMSLTNTTNSKSSPKKIKKKSDSDKNNNSHNHRWSVDDIKENPNNYDTDSDTDSDKSDDKSKSNRKNNKKQSRNRHNESDDDDTEEDENDFYDGESALNIKSPVMSVASVSKEEKPDQKPKPQAKKKVNVNKKKSPAKMKSKKKTVGKKGKENTDKKGKAMVNGDNKEEKMELKLVSKFEVTWNKLSERALNDCNWKDEDCEKLIDEACVLKKKKIIIHSMWITKCKEYCNQNKIKHIKFTVIIGYPNGQICSVAKISEIKYCMKQKVDKIILYICCGKIIDRDWKYIKKEVTSVHKVTGKKCQLEVKYPKSNKISDKTAAIFQQTVSLIIDK